MSNGIFLLLGSNQGNPVSNLERALEHIAKEAGQVAACSSLYTSAAWGVKDQPDFLNQVVEINSAHSPEVLLQKILHIEQQMGRVRREKWGPRLIDIDLLFYGDKVINTPALVVPHPGIPERKFTLQPLAEIAPDFLHPVSKKTVAELLRECRDTLEVKRLLKR
jgi:2-amino-4-hydroxy-6-hydroxymethyldihydropteridine diphosphokinase